MKFEEALEKQQRKFVNEVEELSWEVTRMNNAINRELNTKGQTIKTVMDYKDEFECVAEAFNRLTKAHMQLVILEVMADEIDELPSMEGK